MRTNPLAKLVAIALIAVGCAGSSAEPLSEPPFDPSLRYDYRLTLVTEVAAHYILCQTGQVYCMASSPDSTRDSLQLHVASDGASAQWTIPIIQGTSSLTYELRGTATLRNDATFSTDVNTFGTDQGCVAFHIDAVDVNGSVSGTWSQQLDCHGLSRSGHFTGKR